MLFNPAPIQNLGVEHDIFDGVSFWRIGPIFVIGGPSERQLIPGSGKKKKINGSVCRLETDGLHEFSKEKKRTEKSLILIQPRKRICSQVPGAREEWKQRIGSKDPISELQPGVIGRTDHQRPMRLRGSPAGDQSDEPLTFRAFCACPLSKRSIALHSTLPRLGAECD